MRFTRAVLPRRRAVLGLVTVMAVMLAMVGVAVPAAAGPGSCNGLAVTISGTSGPDLLFGTSGVDVIHGGDGDDVIWGLGSGDTLCGGNGNDTIFGQAGVDTLLGGSGDDLLYGVSGDDILLGGGGDDDMWGGSGWDWISGGPGNDDVWGQNGGDTIFGGPGADNLRGQQGYDFLTAGSGADILDGGADDDVLNGNAGDDLILGGEGFDVSNGGTGDDVCEQVEHVNNCAHTFQLSILHNNDGESDLLGSSTEGGIARFTTLVNDAKDYAVDPANLSDTALSGHWVMLSSGDNFLAGPEFTASLDKGVPFFDTIGMDFIGYDAIAIGNHDFDFNPDVLEDFIMGYSKTAPPYLSANLDFSLEPGLDALVGPSPHMPGDPGRIAASAVIKKGSEYIGVVGATTPNIDFISSPRDTIIDDDVAGAIQDEVDTLEAMGINKIIVISHLQDVEGDIALAAELSGVDVMIAGGGDELLANPTDLLLPSDDPGDVFGPYPMLATDFDGNTVPVVTTSGQYGYLGMLVVEFDILGNVVSWDGAPLRVVDPSVGPDGVTENVRTERKVENPVEDFVADLGSNVIGTSEVALDGTRSSIRSVETNQGNLIADSQLWQATELAPSFGVPVPDVALGNGGGIRNDSVIPAGDITELDTFDMVPFPNFLTLIPDIPRSQFKEILENAVSRTQDGDEPGGTGRFAQIAGFSYTYDTSGTAQTLDDDGNVVVAGTRVQEVELDDGTMIVTGGAVVAGPDVTITIVDFLARGGDQYPFRGAPFTILGVSYQQALANYITGPLAGLISAADYPEGGEGRITPF